MFFPICLLSQQWGSGVSKLEVFIGEQERMGGYRKRTKSGSGKWLLATDDLMLPVLAS